MLEFLQGSRANPLQFHQNIIVDQYFRGENSGSPCIREPLGTSLVVPNVKRKGPHSWMVAIVKWGTGTSLLVVLRGVHQNLIDGGGPLNRFDSPMARAYQGVG